MKKILPLLVLTLFLTTPFIIKAQNMALDFDGTDDYVITSQYINLSFQSYAIEGWFKADILPSAGEYPHIFGVVDSPTDAGFVRINGDNQQLEFVMQSAAGYKVVTSPEVIQAGIWYHAAILLHHYPGFTDTQYLLINGMVVAYNQFPSIGTYSNSLFSIGGDGIRNFDGQVDDVKVWANINRSSQDVRTSMYKEVVGNESNLVAYYNLNETIGTSANDSQSSSTYDATLTNMTGNEWTTSPAFFGPKNCLDFDGLDANVWCPSITPTVTSGTIEFWVNLDVIPTDNARLISRGADYSAGDEIYLAQNDGRIATTGSLVVGDDLISTDPLPTDVWTHVAITADGSGSKLYINGVLDDTGGAAAFGFDSFRFGGQYTAGFYEGIDGMMDEVRLWSDVRTESEIRENMFKNLVGDEANLVAYYNLDNFAGTVTQSYPAEANDGAIGGGATWVASTAFNTWLNTNSSDLATPSNWSNGIPAPTDNVGINDYSGASPILIGNPTVNNLFIGSTSGIILNSGFTVNGNLFLNDNIDLNGQTITLGSTATLYEDNGLISGSTGSITTTRNLNNINENIAGFGATITTAADMGSTVITRGHTEYVTEGNNSIKRYFDITPTNNTGLNATLTFNYDDSELNGLTESNLLLFKSTDSGTTWTNESGTVNTTDNTISLTGIDGFSRWTGAHASSSLTPPGNSLDFDGSDDFVNLTTTNLPNSGNVTVEAWINATTFNSIDDGVIFAKTGATVNQHGYILRSGGSGQIQFVIGSSTTWAAVTSPNNVISTGTWYHVAATYSGAALTLYVNGVQVATNPSNLVIFADSNSNIGRSPVYSSRLFNGQIDEVRVWSDERTALEIKTNMDNPLVGDEIGLAAYYNFDKVNGTTLSDLTTNLNDGTLNNMDVTDWAESYALVIPIPDDILTFDETSFTFSWTAPETGIVESYYIDVDDNLDFSSPLAGYTLFDAGVDTSEIITGLDQSTTYYARVRAYKSSAGQIGAWSESKAVSTSVLRIEENQIKDFSVYPNPTKDLLFVNAEEEIKQIKIFNLLGQQLVEKSVNSKDAILDVKLLPTGSYYLLIYTHNTVKSVQFLIE